MRGLTWDHGHERLARDKLLLYRPLTGAAAHGQPDRAAHVPGPCGHLQPGRGGQGVKLPDVLGWTTRAAARPVPNMLPVYPVHASGAATAVLPHAPLALHLPLILPLVSCAHNQQASIPTAVLLTPFKVK